MAAARSSSPVGDGSFHDAGGAGGWSTLISTYRNTRSPHVAMGPQPGVICQRSSYTLPAESR